jgi:hypothetical protein
LLLMQHTRNVAVHLRGRAALAGAIAAEGAERRARLGVARASTARLRRRGGWGGAMAALLTAGVERVAGRDVEASVWLSRAVDETGAHRPALFEAAARFSAGDPAGEAWMRSNGVRAPAALARMLVPGASR